MKSFILTLTARMMIANAEASTGEYQVGDMIMQSDEFKSAAGIKILSGSKYNHVGIIVEKNGTLYVAEALGRVVYTDIDEYINRGQEHVHIRLNDELTDSDKTKISKAVKKYVGKRYDAALSWSDDRMYCSELVQKVYKDALEINVATERKIKQHGMVVFVPLLKSGVIEVPAVFSDVVENIDTDEIVVTPADILRSENTRRVD